MWIIIFCGCMLCFVFGLILGCVISIGKNSDTMEQALFYRDKLKELYILNKKNINNDKTGLIANIYREELRYEKENGL